MTDHSELIKKLRDLHRDQRPASAEWLFENQVALYDAAAAIEALQAQMPKRGEIVRCGECAHCYAEGFAHERNICEKHPELGNVPDDWFCADGEREVQDESAGSL